MAKIIDLDKHRPPPKISEDASVCCCDYCGWAEYFVDVDFNIWCSSCMSLAWDNSPSEYEIEIELDLDDL